MNIYKQEFRFLLKSTIIWTLTIIAIIIFFFSLFPTLVHDSDQYKKLLSNYPPQVLQAIGATIDQFVSPTGFYSFCFMYVSICGAIQAMTFGVLVLSKEGARKTCDFIFTKPATRTKILLSKLFAALTSIILTNIIFISVSYLTVLAIAKDFDFTPFLLISLTLFFIQLIFLSLGFLIAAIIKRIKSPIPVSLSIVLGFFVLSIIVNITNDQNLRYISFFNYFKANYIVQHNGYEPTFLILTIAAIIIFITSAFIYFNKKDIHSV